MQSNLTPVLPVEEGGVDEREGSFGKNKIRGGSSMTTFSSNSYVIYSGSCLKNEG